MHRDVKDRRRKKAGKRFFLSISCLILLSFYLLFLTYAAGLGIEEKRRAGEEVSFQKGFFAAEDKGNEEDEKYRAIFREAGGFDNPIDDFYLSGLCYCDKSKEYDTLAAYEAAWREQLSGYVKSCGTGNGDMALKKAAGEYLKAVLNAVYAQKNLMEYMGVDQERIFWYSAQIYRYAFIRDIKGEFTGDVTQAMALNGKEGNLKEIPGKAYEIYGEFTNETDQEFIKAFYDGKNAVWAFEEGWQGNFDIDWCNRLCELTMDFYEGLDEEGIYLAGIWQESRESWKRASNEFFWIRAEGTNGKKKDAYFEEEALVEMMERDGWINRLYFLQLQSICALSDMEAGMERE